MNFLAHCALAFDAAQHWQAAPADEAGLLAGAVVGDFTKGTLDLALPDSLRAGIRVHRRIDALSNQDRALIELADGYPTELRRYAPIFVDLLIDHALARRWQDFYEMEVAQFSSTSYAAIAAYETYLPERGRRFFGYMKEVDLLATYSDEAHLEDGLRSVLRRLNTKPLADLVIESTFANVPAAERALPELYGRYQRYWQTWPSMSGFLSSMEANAEPRNS